MQKPIPWWMLAFLFILIPCPAVAQVSWVQKFDDAVSQAQREGKFIVVDFATTWCPPCQKMAREVYLDRDFIDFSRSHIFMLLDAEKNPEGERLARRFNVVSYPTILILDSKGQEIDRLVGGRDARALIRDLQAIYDNPQPYHELVQKAKESDSDPILLLRAGDRAFERNDYALAIQLLDRVIRTSNASAESRSVALLLLASARFKSGKYSESLAALDEYDRLAPKAESQTADLRFLRARILIAAKRYDEGYQILDELLRTSSSREKLESVKNALAGLPGKYRKGSSEYNNLIKKAGEDLKKGKLDSALSQASKAADMAPQAADVHLLLASIYLKLGNSAGNPADKSQDLSLCLNELRLARRLDPEDFNTYLAVKSALASNSQPQYPASAEAQKSFAEAQARFAEGRYNEAAKAYVQTASLEPGFGKAYLFLGDCYFATGRMEDALKLYQTAIAKSPLDPATHRFAADALVKLGRTEEARNYYVSSLLADPEYPMIWKDFQRIANAEGRGLQRHQDIVPIQFLLLALDTGTYNENIYDNLPPQTVPAWREYVRSKLLWRQEKFQNTYPNSTFYSTSFEEESESLQSAVQRWSALKEQDPSLRDENLDFLRQIYVDGQLAAFVYIELFTEEYRKPFERWKMEHEADANNYIRTYLMGMTGVRSRGEYNSSAIQAYNDALVSHKSGNKNEAVELYNKALAQEPRMTLALRNLSILYFEMNDFEHAAKRLESWIEAEPGAADPHMMLAQIYYRAGNREAAVREAQKGMDIEPDPAKKSQYQKLVDVLSGTGNIIIMTPRTGSPESNPAPNTDEGIANLERRLASTKEGDERDSLLLMLAVAHFDAKHWDQARNFASMVLAKDPEQATARAIMENLQNQGR